MNNTPDAWKKVETERVLARKVFTSIGDDGIDMRFKGSYIESESEQRERLAHLVKNSIPEELKKNIFFRKNLRTESKCFIACDEYY